MGEVISRSRPLQINLLPFPKLKFHIVTFRRKFVFKTTLSVITMIVKLSLVSLIPLLVNAVHHEHLADLHKCDLCECFVKYENRDLWSPVRPYLQAEAGQILTEDLCLARCLRDKRCGAVVFGFIGGRESVGCEWYETANLPGGPRYVYGMDLFVPRVSMPCMLDYTDVPDIAVAPDNGRASRRKAAYRRLYQQRNPFNFGRR